MEEKSNQSRFLDNLLALLITVLSVLTAFVTYLAADTDGKSTEFYFLAQSNLSDANYYYLQGNLDVSTDYENYDRAVVEAGIDDFASEYYLANLSPAALESMERPDGPFDDEYFLVVYETADAFQADADAAFIEANRLAKIANRYQLVAFALAVGLSFTAWSSLSNANLRIRWLFAILSVLTLLASLGALLLAFLTNLFS